MQTPPDGSTLPKPAERLFHRMVVHPEMPDQRRDAEPSGPHLRRFRGDLLVDWRLRRGS